jgi:hypothetical protein
VSLHVLRIGNDGGRDVVGPGVLLTVGFTLTRIVPENVICGKALTVRD